MLLQPIPNKVRIRSFWITAGILLGTLTFVGLGLFAELPSVARLSASLAVTAANLVALLAPMHVSEKPYRSWNYGVRKFSQLATRYVTAVCFLTIVLPRLRQPPEQASEFDVDSNSATMWRSRGSQAASSFPYQWSASSKEITRRFETGLSGWLRQAAPDYAWSFTPFVLLMRFLSVSKSRDRQISTHTYTLY